MVAGGTSAPPLRPLTHFILFYIFFPPAHSNPHGVMRARVQLSLRPIQRTQKESSLPGRDRVAIGCVVVHSVASPIHFILVGEKMRCCKRPFCCTAGSLSLRCSSLQLFQQVSGTSTTPGMQLVDSLSGSATPVALCQPVRCFHRDHTHHPPGSGREYTKQQAPRRAPRPPSSSVSPMPATARAGGSTPPPDAPPASSSATAWRRTAPVYSPDDLEEVILRPLTVALIPFSPQAVRVSFVYQALQATWKELVRIVISVSKVVDVRFAERSRRVDHQAQAQQAQQQQEEEEEEVEVWWESLEDVLRDPEMADVIQDALLLRPRYTSPSLSMNVPYSPGEAPWLERIPVADAMVKKVFSSAPLAAEGGHEPLLLARCRRLFEVMGAIIQANASKAQQRVPSTGTGNSSRISGMMGMGGVDVKAMLAAMGEIPRQHVRERHGSFKNFIKANMQEAAIEEKRLENNDVEVREVAAHQKEEEDQQQNAPQQQQQQQPGDVEGVLKGSALHPFLYAGVFLSQDGLFTTRALSRLEAGIVFSTFYAPPPVNLNPNSRPKPGCSAEALRGVPPAEEAGDADDDDDDDDVDVRLHLCADPIPPAPGSTRASRPRSLSARRAASMYFSCRPVAEVESLLECGTLLDKSEDAAALLRDPPPRHEPSGAEVDGPRPDAERSSGGANVFSPEMLMPILPSYFVPLHLLGPRLPAGYTPAHVRELFGRMVKHVEMVQLPPLPPVPTPSPAEPGTAASSPSPPTPSSSSSLYLRLHEGLREHKERVVDFSAPANWNDVWYAHNAADYRHYRPDPALANAFRALFLVRVPFPVEGRSANARGTTANACSTSTSSSSSGGGGGGGGGVENSLKKGESSTRAEGEGTDPQQQQQQRYTWVIRNDWLALRDVVERAPRHLRDALLPLRAAHTLLFFAQQQQHFQFTPEKGGFIRLAGSYPPTKTASTVKPERDGEGPRDACDLPPSVRQLGGLLPGHRTAGVARTGLGRHNSPTPLAVSEVAALLEQRGCVYVADLEASRTWEFEQVDEHQDPAAAAATTAEAGGRSVTPKSRYPPLMTYLLRAVASGAGDGDSGRGSPSAAGLCLSDRTKRDVLAHYGSLRRFLACHHGDVFSLRLAPLSPALCGQQHPPLPPWLEAEEDSSGADGGEVQEGGASVAGKQPCTGFASAGRRVLEEADYAQQIPAPALLAASTLSTVVTYARPTPTASGERGERLAGDEGEDQSDAPPQQLCQREVHLLDSPNLMVELWSKYEERQAGSKAVAASHVGVGGVVLGGSGSGGGGLSSAPASASPYLSSAAVSALTLEQQLEYAVSLRDRRRAQKIRRQIAQRNDPEAAFTDPEVLFNALLRYVPTAKHISLRFLLRHLPTSITDFLPANVTTWLQRFEKEGKIQVFEYRYRHCIYLLRPGLPLPDGALRKTFTDEELVRIVACDIQQRYPRPARMAFLYGLLPLGAKEELRKRHKTLQTFLMRYPEHFVIIAESKSERSSLVRLLNPPTPLTGRTAAELGLGQVVDGGASGGHRGGGGEALVTEPSQAELERSDEQEKAMVMEELAEELKQSMRWN
eukprot:gene8969-6292_t